MAIVYYVFIFCLIMPAVYEKIAPKTLVSYQTLYYFCIAQGLGHWSMLVWWKNTDWFPNQFAYLSALSAFAFNVPAAIWVWETTNKPIETTLTCFIPAAGMCAAFHHLDTTMTETAPEHEMP